MEIDRRIRDVGRLFAAISFSFSVSFAQSPGPVDKVLTKLAFIEFDNRMGNASFAEINSPSLP